MSSFFRSANDITASQEDTDASENSNSDDSRSNGEEGHDKPLTGSEFISKVNTLDSTTSETEPIPDSLALIDNSSRQHSDYVLHALLEEKCLNEALAYFQEQHGSRSIYTADHPDVKSLAQAKYSYMSEQLGQHGLVPLGPEQDESRQLRHAYRQGLDLLSSRGPLPGRAGLASRPGSSTSLNVAMRNLAIPGSRTSSKSLLSPMQLELYSRSQEGVSTLPVLLRPLVDHPIIELSRYLRDFSEVGIIGKGGYGKVYRVKHKLDGSDYAVKKIALNATRVKRIQERGQAELDSLLSELRMLARFDHPNIVRYYGGWLEYTLPPLPPPLSSLRQQAPSPKLIGGPGLDAAGSHSYTIDSKDRTDFSGSDGIFDLSNGDINVVFERSGGEVLGEVDDFSDHGDLLPNLRSKSYTSSRRRTNESTMTSVKSKQSTVHSIRDGGEEHLETVLEAHQPSDSSDHASSSSEFTAQGKGNYLTESQLTLHIQMSLHPLSLADFLSSIPPYGDVGENLSSLRHCFHVQPSLQILLAILDGVEYLHGCGVVHRDLKPTNIFLSLHHTHTPACVDLSKCPRCKADETNRSAFLNARIGDFGLVTAIARPNTQRPTAPPKVVGTELYRPANSVGNAEESLDVYALGIIAAELLFPFTTRMERQAKLLELRDGQLSEDSFTAELGENSSTLVDCIKMMTCGEEQLRLTCPQVRERIGKLLT